jgi:hypothetical protein
VGLCFSCNWHCMLCHFIYFGMFKVVILLHDCLCILQVIYLWGKTIGRRHDFAKRAGIMVVAINLLTSFLGICFLCEQIILCRDLF